MVDIPFEKIKKELAPLLPDHLIDDIPSKWEKIGEVVVLRLPDSVKPFKESLGEIYAHVLGCKSVLNDFGGIKGEFRTPRVELVYGDKDTVTVHRENNVRFKLDPMKVMFSSGNMDERIRMANISNKDEIVVDLFAGIGYFSIPMAVHSQPKLIYACEKNPVSYGYLCENIALNNVTSRVKALKGDNREVAPVGVADRVIMGYIEDNLRFLPQAIKCLKEKRGKIHFHNNYPDNVLPDKAFKNIGKIVKKYNVTVGFTNVKKVKSFAPGIGHYVFDLEVE